MQLKRVVFPAPFGPTSPMDSPRSIERFTSCTAATPPKDFVMPSATSNGHGAPRRSPSTNRDGRRQNRFEEARGLAMSASRGRLSGLALDDGRRRDFIDGRMVSR